MASLLTQGDALGCWLVGLQASQASPLYVEIIGNAFSIRAFQQNGRMFSGHQNICFNRDAVYINRDVVFIDCDVVYKNHDVG